MGDFQAYKLDWYHALRRRLEGEHEAVLVVPPFEYRCNVFTELMFSLCSRVGMDGHPEVKYKALQYFEKTVETKLSASDLSESVAVDFAAPSPLPLPTPGVVASMVACVWVAAKEVTLVDLPTAQDFVRTFPQLNARAVTEAEQSVLRGLGETLGKPNVFSCVEVLLGVLESPSLAAPTRLSECLQTADQFLTLLSINKYMIFKEVFTRIHKRNPDNPNDVYQMRVMMRDQIFQAASAILASGYVLNLNIEDLTRRLTYLTGISYVTQNFMAKILLKGIRDNSNDYRFM